MMFEKIEPLPQQRSSKIQEKQLGDISENLAQKKEDIIRENTELITQQVKKLQKFHSQVSQIVKKLSDNKKNCRTTIQSLQNQINQLDDKVRVYLEEIKQNNIEQQLKHKIKKLNDQYVTVCKVYQYKKTIKNINRLKKVNSNIITMYLETESKFYWPNFKKQAFGKDKGYDFIQRLGKIKAMQTKQEQRIKTQWFLDHYLQISHSPQLKDAVQEVHKIRNIAERFRRGYQLSAQINQYQQNIRKHKQETLEKDQASMKWKARSEALSDRIKINNQYLVIITEVEQKLKSRLSLYQEKAENGKQMQKQFDDLNKWRPSIQVATKKENCECVLF